MYADIIGVSSITLNSITVTIAMSALRDITLTLFQS